jgi:hypothetical protein
MLIKRPIVRLAAACWLISTASLWATSNALIVIGSTGDSTVAGDLNGVANTIHDSLVQRGFDPNSIEMMGTASSAKATRDTVLASLKKRESLAATDEFWVILLGFSGRTADGDHAFQVAGPRLTEADLKAALDPIRAQQFIFIGTSDSGGFVPGLLQPNRSILSATKEEGEVDLPRFPESWSAALKEKPKASWKEIAARAAELTDKDYSTGGLAVGEHSRLGDPVTNKILEAPFGVDATAKPAEKPQSDGSMALINASDIKVEIRKPNAEWEKQEATAETKKLIADAKAVPNPDGFNAIVLEQRLGYHVGEDRAAEDFVMQRIYIEKEDGVERWANFTFPQDPPAVSTKLEAARIIQPDGSSTVFNPAKLPPASSETNQMGNASTAVFLPDAHAGCLIEIAYRTRHLLDVGQPQFSEGIPVQLDVPVLHTELQLQVPEKSQLHFKLRNNDVKPTDVAANGVRTVSWKLDNLAAFESLPFDPPARDFLVSLDISSLNSWDDFAAWYHRLAKGSDVQDAAVKAKAAELAEGAKTRLDKIRHAYEFVSALRYVAIEFGVNAIRPRTPAVVLQNRYGDCKDKANLLIALLADMGIDGNFVVLNRFSSTDVDFPSWQFNHAIAFVPKAPDAGQPEDLWLDTTDSTAPFPTLSPGDIGRNALVFDKDSAKFLQVAAPGKSVTEVKEDWKFQPSTDGKTVQGTLQKTWSGLAEYDVRSMVRGRSPRQRDYMLQTELTRQLPNADFTNLNLTPADDLSKLMSLDAKVDAASDASPLTSFDVASLFAAPERNRPLEINSGQKLHLIQTVESIRESSVDIEPSFDQQVAGIHATISWKVGTDHVSTRTADLTIDQPLVAPSDYPAVRKMMRDWNQQLSR